MWCRRDGWTFSLPLNVREFTSWGPLNARGRPIQRKKGATFIAFLDALRSLDYTVDFRILNAANYGDPTTRERLFILARRGKRVHWPEPSHAPPEDHGHFGKRLAPWRTAREIIDWSIPGSSIFDRKRSEMRKTLMTGKTCVGDLRLAPDESGRFAHMTDGGAS
jgi:DNA (cytosine-5)-methyltransferase 1